MSGDSLEGQNLDKYRILEPLGRGGMARVYRAYHPQLDRYVAIKVLRSDLVDEDEFPARFTREARAVARLRHPNIVQVFDFDVRGDVYYMVMELLPGDTLRRRLDDHRARNQRMPLGEVVRVLLDVLDGLGYAHDEGMIHRDVKPANILLTRRGEAVLSDFGIAQIVGGTRHTASGALMGTLSYMAPEQGLEGHCDARSDLYSLGIVFYEMLTGEPPYDAETPLAILMKHVNDPLPLPRQRCPEIPPAFERVVLKTLAKRPGDRYQSAAALATGLQLAAQEAGVALPDSLSLPLSFTTPAAPSESVVVLSGEDRDRMLDAEFAADDTDAHLGRSLVQGESPAAAAAVVAGEAQRQARQAVHAAVQIVKLPASTGGGPLSLGQAVLRGVSWLVLGNLLVVFFLLLTGWSGVYGRGWPFELLLVGLFLALLTEALGNRWLLIPTGIVLGNGYLMAFYAITGAWILWRFFWPLELAIVGGSIWLALVLGRREAEGQATVRGLARLVQRPTVVLIPIVVLLGALVG